ncbi:hypothetical protein D3C81_2228870 [compost metagenome]
MLAKIHIKHEFGEQDDDGCLGKGNEYAGSKQADDSNDRRNWRYAQLYSEISLEILMNIVN